MKTIFQTLVGAFLALILFFGLIFFALSSFISSQSRTPDRPESMVLTIDLRNQLSDQPVSGGFASFGGSKGFTDLMMNLRAAETDPAVKGIVVRASQSSIGSARAEELRDAFLRLQDNGKFIIVHGQGWMMGGPSAYRAVSTADEIWLQPGTDFSITGLSFEAIFFADMLERISVKPEFVQLYEYKSAVDTFTENQMTTANREALGTLGESVWSVSIDDIAADREKDPAALRTLLESGPMSAEDALQQGLADKLGYPDEIFDAARERVGDEDVPFVSALGYRPQPIDPDAPLIALVGGEGAIVTGTGQSGPFDSEVSFASDRIASALLAAAKDENVKAIVFRIDSGGGDAFASDQIWNAVKKAQEKGKPVVVSMGSVAASGGYYAAAGADYIFASDTTITGSIGVFAGKFAVTDAAARIGVTFDAETVGGDYAGAFGADPFTPEQYEVFRNQIVRTYDRFINIVADGRGISENQARSVARGRIWSGKDARGNGLVDGRGGLIDAIEKAKELGGIDAEVTARVVYYPMPRDGLQDLISSIVSVETPVPSVRSALAEILGERDARLLTEEVRRVRAIRAGRVEVIAPQIIER